MLTRSLCSRPSLLASNSSIGHTMFLRINESLREVIGTNYYLI